ncbi:hypothetical protein ACFQGT_10655 [Natrialbaceae archaeon GCM10025810]|uniref:hypothetical protein n=1 Tax=Halovalidus salilacus TaxID=3075124 RepID=UPI00361AE60A
MTIRQTGGGERPAADAVFEWYAAVNRTDLDDATDALAATVEVIEQTDDGSDADALEDPEAVYERAFGTVGGVDVGIDRVQVVPQRVDHVATDDGEVTIHAEGDLLAVTEDRSRLESRFVHHYDVTGGRISRITSHAAPISPPETDSTLGEKANEWSPPPGDDRRGAERSKATDEPSSRSTGSSDANTME